MQHDVTDPTLAAQFREAQPVTLRSRAVRGRSVTALRRGETTFQKPPKERGPAMKWLTDLLKEYPALAVAEQRLKLHEEEFYRLKIENERLAKENQALKTKLAAATPPSFIEERGVLWRFDRLGTVGNLAYCPTCRLAMSPFPPNANLMLICTKCNFQAPFKPNEVARIAAELSKSLADERGVAVEVRPE
jgi:hypothetical protein